MLESVAKAVKKHGTKRDALLPVLQDIQNECGHLSKDAMEEVAKAFDVSSADVYGTASFYSFFKVKPAGKYTIRLCKTISCDMQNKEAIIEAVEEKLGIRLGETTPDSKFTFLETNCLGFCHKGPAMLINDEVHTEVTAEKAVKILESLS